MQPVATAPGLWVWRTAMLGATAGFGQKLTLTLDSMTINPEKLHEALMYCVDFAKTMLRDAGEFYPFGAAVGSDEKVRAVGVSDGNEHPNSRDLYRILEDALFAGATDGRIVAAAIASNVNIPPEYSAECSDGIRVQLEAGDYSRYVYFPYRLTKSGLFKKKIDVAVFEPFAVERSPSIFRPTRN
jgi:hypothetical protein